MAGCCWFFFQLLRRDEVFFCFTKSTPDAREKIMNLRKNNNHTRTFSNVKELVCVLYAHRCMCLFINMMKVEAISVSLFSFRSAQTTESMCERVSAHAKHLWWRSIISECGKIDYKNLMATKTMAASKPSRASEIDSNERDRILWWMPVGFNAHSETCGSFSAKISGSNGSARLKEERARAHTHTLCSDQQNSREYRSQRRRKFQRFKSKLVINHNNNNSEQRNVHRVYTTPATVRDVLLKVS